MKKGRCSLGGVNMTPMIDVVFQMIIFFVCTAQIEKETVSEWIRLAEAPHAPAMEREKDPRTITIEVDERGRLSIAGTRLSERKLGLILRKTVGDYGAAGPSIPILIRADGSVQQGVVRRVMDLCTGAGLDRIAFVVLKEAAEEGV